MTRNQVDYLNYEESKRNNLVTAEENKRHNQAVEGETHRNNLVLEAQGADRNTETKRNNLAVLKESKRHAKATEKQAKVSTKVQSGTTIAAASISNEAVKYSTDVRAATDYAKQANDYSIAALNNATAEKIQDAKNKTSKFLKSIDKLMQSKQLKQSDRESLRKLYGQLKTNNDKLSADATQKELDRQVKLINSAAAWLATAVNMAKTGKESKLSSTAKEEALKRMRTDKTSEYLPGVFREKTGSSPASGKSSSTDTKAPPKKVVINKKKFTKKDYQNQKKAIAKRSTFTKNPLAKVKQYTKY